jgi:hypothetical protein
MSENYKQRYRNGERPVQKFFLVKYDKDKNGEGNTCKDGT